MEKTETGKNILRGPEPTIVLPSDLSLGQFMLDRIATYHDRVALINGKTGEETTFAEILSKSLKLAVYLTNQGLRRDDRIAICSENSPEYPVLVCTAAFLGATICPLNPGYTRREFEHALTITRAGWIFASESAIATVAEIARELPWSPRVICTGKRPVGNAPSVDQLVATVLAPKPEKFKIPDLNPSEHVAAILCSSGTTGLPKGVMLTDANILFIVSYFMESAIFAQGRTEAADRTEVAPLLAILPYFHAYAFVTMIVQLLVGHKAVELTRFEPKKFLSVIEKYKISNLMLVPPLVVFLAKSPLVKHYDLSSVKNIWCGAAPLSPVIAKAVCDKLNIPVIHQAYGLTETTLGVMGTIVGNVVKPGSVGKLRPGVLAKVMPLDGDESQEPLGPNQRGELCFKGPLIMKGYCGDVAATAATIDKNGWLHSGDIGYYDEDYVFYIVDRQKELIKYKGYQVAPAELESILLTHPKVADAAVIGVPDETSGELPLAFVVKQPGANVTASEIVKFVEARVSKEKRLRGGVRFVASVPKTASGKILRRELRDLLKSKL